MIIRWIKDRLVRWDAKDALYRELATDPAVAGVFEPWDIARGVDKLSPAMTRDLLKFITERKDQHTSLPLDIMKVLRKYSDAWGRIGIITRNFDRAEKLGWNYAPNNITCLLEAIDDVRGYGETFTPEQEAALLTLEDSRWVKKYTRNGGKLQEAYSFHPSVRKVVLERPQDVQRIIPIVRKYNPQHAAHLISILDGDISFPLGDGAL